MKKLALLALGGLMLAGCYNLPRYEAAYEFGIKSAQVNGQTLKPTNSEPLVIEDEQIRLSFDLSDHEAIGFTAENKTGQTLKVLWEESAFMTSDGQTMRIFHYGVKISDRDQPQPPSLVGPGGKLKDAIYPAGYTQWINIGSGGGGWASSDIMPDIFWKASHDKLHKLESAINNAMGMEIYGLLLTLDTPSGKREYLVKFGIHNAKIVDIR